MKILHTSDWHLGQKFLNNSRLQENKQALDWLLETIEREKVDVLIIAGDIFDTMNPPNHSRKLYYNFLTQLEKTACQHTVIIGGNHDSPSMLNAPRELLKTKNIHVLGNTTDRLEDEIIELLDKKGSLKAVIAAVPFLRDSDIRKSVAGELFEDREERIRTGIKNHYHQIADAMAHYEAFGVPILATGHLSVLKKVKDDEKISRIYIGSLENINPDDFPKIFDYIALGHIHRTQPIGEFPHIRYSGTLIPLNFTEQTKKSVTLLDFKGRNFEKTILHVPIYRRLIRVTGTYQEVTEALAAIETDANLLTGWIEVVVKTDKGIPNLNDELKAIVADKDVEILKCRLEATILKETEKIELMDDLKEMSELEVFGKKCEAEGYDEAETDTLTNTFKELVNWMEERDID
ncbi:MAG: exonuclease SbcD [Cognaticolwellia sp.]|jgi:exonuclease SbcD